MFGQRWGSSSVPEPPNYCGICKCICTRGRPCCVKCEVKLRPFKDKVDSGELSDFPYEYHDCNMIVTLDGRRIEAA